MQLLKSDDIGSHFHGTQIEYTFRFIKPQRVIV